MEKIYVLDASGYIYRSYFAIRNMTNAKGESTNALFGFIRSVLKLIKDFQPTHFVAVFDGPHNAKARVAIYADYKAHRAAMPPDLLHQIEWAEKFCNLLGLPLLKIPEVEADDTMGTIAKWAAKKGLEVFLCTSDKDMCQMVDDRIKILNTHKENLILDSKGVEENFGVPPHLIVDLLSMIGDASDNIPGVPGFGPKTAATLLQQHQSLDHLLAHPECISGKKGDLLVAHKEDALLSRKLVTLHTDVDIPREASFYHIHAPRLAELKEFYASMGFQSLLRELEQTTPAPSPLQEENEHLDYQLVDDEESLKRLIDYLSQQKEVCFDTETTSIHPIVAELVGIGFAVEPKKAWYVPANGQLGLQKVLAACKSLFENPKIGFFGHHIKYDSHILLNYGIKIANIAFDTLLASYLLNSHNRQHSLENLALEYFGKVTIPISDLIGKGKNMISMRDVPIEKVCTYCCEDVDYTCRLKQILEPQLHERKLMKLFSTVELPLVPVLMKMERHGIFLDKNVLAIQGGEVSKQIQNLVQEIYTLAEGEFNLNSPKQLGDHLVTKMRINLPKTATGYSTSADVLESLRHTHDIIDKILEYRGIEKLRSTYIETLPAMINPKSNRIHCTFNQSGTATGRLSCQDPNLQNIPIRTEAGRRIREAFRPQKEGWSYLAADYSQIELRLLAHLSEDPNLVQAFQNNEDIHAHTASVIFGIPLSEVTQEQRYSAKAVNFGIIYGQQAFGLSQELGIPVKEASAFIDTYFQKYSRVKEFIEECHAKARKTGKAVTLIGRERAIPEINNKNFMLRNAAERLAINTPLQGTAADLIKMAMLHIDKRLQKEGLLGYMILQIHDELVFELPDFEKDYVSHLVKDTMQSVLKLKVPLIVDISVGKNWKEC